jgi:hypothetical protein
MMEPAMAKKTRKKAAAKAAKKSKAIAKKKNAKKTKAVAKKSRKAAAPKKSKSVVKKKSVARKKTIKPPPESFPHKIARALNEVFDTLTDAEHLDHQLDPGVSREPE